MAKSELSRPPSSGESEPHAVEAYLRRHLASSDVVSGDRLPSEAELVNRLGVSRVSVREALHGLEAVGLVASRPGLGWFVKAFGVEALVANMASGVAFHDRLLPEFLEIRRAVEGEVVASLVGRVTRPVLGRLEELASHMSWNATRRKSFAVQDREFHRTLVDASGNRMALALIDLYWRLILAAQAQGLPGPSDADAPLVAQSHHDIVTTLRGTDVDECRATLRRHHEEASQRYARWLDEAEASGHERASDVRVALQASLLERG